MKSIHYKGKIFKSLRGHGFKSFFSETGEKYWISGCKKGGDDRLYDERFLIHIDEDVQIEYWEIIRERAGISYKWK